MRALPLWVAPASQSWEYERTMGAAAKPIDSRTGADARITSVATRRGRPRMIGYGRAAFTHPTAGERIPDFAALHPGYACYAC